MKHENDRRFEREFSNEGITENLSTTCPGCEAGCSLEAPACSRGRAIASGEEFQEQQYPEMHGGRLAYDDRVPGELRPSADSGDMHEDRKANHLYNHHTKEKEEPIYDDRVPGMMKQTAAGLEQNRRPHHGPGHLHGPHHKGPDAPLPDDGSLSSLLFRASHSLGHPGVVHGASQDRILRFLSVRGKISQHTLQEHLDIQPGSLSELLSKMEDKGLLTRDADETDRRRILIHLSETGQREASTLSHAKEADCFAVLTEEEKETLRVLLQKIVNASGSKPDPFFDRSGRLTRLPSKRHPRFIALRRMSELFDFGHDYNEKEINEILRAGMAFDDIELVRRELVESGLLRRTADGSRYWRQEEAK